MQKKNMDMSHIKENLKNPRVKGLLFFGFYFIFFVILFVMLGSNQNKTLETEENKTTDITYYFDLIDQNNYHFQYQIIEDETVTMFEGDKTGTKESFVKTTLNESIEYFNHDGIFLEKSDTWKLSTSPYLYRNFLDVKEINRFLKNSTFISKTEYSNQEICYQYDISTTTLVSLLEEKDVDLMDQPNIIRLYVQDNEVYKIELDLTSYIQYVNQEYQKLIINMEYSQFNTIEELQTPEYDRDLQDKE